MTVREERQVVFDEQLAATAPAVQSISATSAGVGPSPADQLRVNARCHQHPQLTGRLTTRAPPPLASNPRSVRGSWLRRHEALSPLVRRYIPDSGSIGQSNLPSCRSPRCITDFAAIFPRSVDHEGPQLGRSKVEVCRVIVRHFLDWWSRNTVRAALGEASPGAAHQASRLSRPWWCDKGTGRCMAPAPTLVSQPMQCGQERVSPCECRGK